MKTVLVTGANGQLGKEIGKLSAALPGLPPIVCTTRKELDITSAGDVEKFIDGSNIEFLVNCAAYTNVDLAEKEKEKAFLVNHDSVRNLVSAAGRKDIHIIHISTDYVFDGKSNIPYREEDVAAPLSVYGMSKLKGEKEVLKYAKGMIIRTSWLYSSSKGNFFSTMLRLGRENEEVRVVFDQTGSPTFAGDLAGAIMKIVAGISGDQTGFSPGIFHYANEGVCSRYDLAVEIMKAAGMDCRVVPVESDSFPVPAARPHYSVLNKSKIKRLYSINIPHWRESLLKCTTEVNI